MNASGTFGHTSIYQQLIDFKKLGAYVTKTITLKEREGNPPPRLLELKGGLINSIGLQNIGIKRFLKEEFEEIKKLPTNIIISVGGESEEEYSRVIEILENVPYFFGLEINISCPNVKRGGVEIGRSSRRVYSLVKQLRGITNRPLIVKLGLSDRVVEIAQRVEGAGASAISLINTVKGGAVWNNSLFCGGVSGPMIKPLALRAVGEVSQKVKIPIIGMGGIAKVEDAFDFFRAGAKAVAIGSGNFRNPRLMLEISERLTSER
jgi:dihydroorotate dehydrogenase (NAD+) catalytic subunit